MEKIAFISGETIYYWSSIVLTLATLTAICFFWSLYLGKGGNGVAAFSVIPLAIALSLLLGRLVHWYCRTSSYDSFEAAMKPFSPGGLTYAGFSDEPFVAYTKPHKKASFSLFAGGGVAGGNSEGLAPRMLNTSIKNDASSVIGNGNSLAPLRSSGYGESSFRHHQPLSFGIAVRKEFAHGLSLESGVNYTLLRSDVRMQYTSDDVAQKLHFIGVPLRFNWQFLERGRFSLYMGAGGMVEKCVSARLGSETVDEPGVQWSALAAVGAQYRVGGMVGLYFEPEGSYYFTETGLRTSRTDSPLTLTLRLGVRLSF